MHLTCVNLASSPKKYRGKLCCLPRFLHEYRGKYSTAPVESAPMKTCAGSMCLNGYSTNSPSSFTFVSGITHLTNYSLLVSKVAYR